MSKQSQRDKPFKRFIPLGLILVCLVIVYFSGAYKIVSFEQLQTNHRKIKLFLNLHPVITPLLFILFYIFMTALSVPGALFLTVLGGYLFPQPLSTLYVVFAATCGATIIFFAVRTAWGSKMQKGAKPFFKKMEKGFQKNAAGYLLFLRLIPLFPFWIVNIAPAFFRVPLKTFIWTTVIGIAPGTLAFTLTGAGLEKLLQSGKAFSMDALLNPEMKIGLFLVSLFILLPMIIFELRKKTSK